MDWNKIDKIIQEIVCDIKDKCIIKNTAIRDTIFGILEDKCTVIYYPLTDEKNRGFHIKRIVKNELEDFVYINTASSRIHFSIYKRGERVMINKEQSTIDDQSIKTLTLIYNEYT